MRTAEQTALLIALLFQRSEQRQARLDTGTIRCLSKRRHIRSAFVKTLTLQLDRLGLILMELDGGGFGLLASSTLAGAPTVTIEAYLADELDRLQQGEIDFNNIRDALEPESQRMTVIGLRPGSGPTTNQPIH